MVSSPTHIRVGLRSRKRIGWVTGAVALALIPVAYGLVAVFSQPLARGEAVSSDRGVLQPPRPEGSGQVYLMDYADGQTVTLTNWIRNQGLVPLTVTGIRLPPPGYRGLIGVQAARAGVLTAQSVLAGCCSVDQATTWRAGAFAPLRLNPGQEGAVVIRFLMSNCEWNSGGGTVSIPSVPVDFTVIGFPRTEQLSLNAGVEVKVPDGCPRPPAYAQG